MIDTEARVRATLTAVAAATALDHSDARYVESPRPRHFPVRTLAATAAAAAAVAAVFLLGAPAGPGSNGSQPARPAAQVPSPSTLPTPPGPEGGRLITEGTVSGRAWALYGADRLPDEAGVPAGTWQGPCWFLAVQGLDATSRGCGSDPASSAGFRQLGPVFVPGEEALVFGVLSPEVVKVLVQVDSTRPAIEIIPGIDPGNPMGPKYFVAQVPRVPEKVTVRMLAEGELVLRSADIDVDGPVGG